MKKEVSKFTTAALFEQMPVPAVMPAQGCASVVGPARRPTGGNGELPVWAYGVMTAQAVPHPARPTVSSDGILTI